MRFLQMGPLAKAAVHGRDFAAVASHHIDQPLTPKEHEGIFQGFDQVLSAFYRLCPPNRDAGETVFSAVDWIRSVAENRLELGQDETGTVKLSATPIRRLHGVFSGGQPWEREKWYEFLREEPFWEELEPLIKDEEHPLSHALPPTGAARDVVMRQLFEDWDDKQSVSACEEDYYRWNYPFTQLRVDTVAVLAQRGIFGQETMRSALSHEKVPARTKLLLASALAGFPDPDPTEHDAGLIVGALQSAETRYEIEMLTDALATLGELGFKHLVGCIQTGEGLVPQYAAWKLSQYSMIDPNELREISKSKAEVELLPFMENIHKTALHTEEFFPRFPHPILVGRFHLVPWRNQT